MDVLSPDEDDEDEDDDEEDDEEDEDVEDELEEIEDDDTKEMNSSVRWQLNSTAIQVTFFIQLCFALAYDKMQIPVVHIF